MCASWGLDGFKMGAVVVRRADKRTGGHRDRTMVTWGKGLGKFKVSSFKTKTPIGEEMD